MDEEDLIFLNTLSLSASLLAKMMMKWATVKIEFHKQLLAAYKVNPQYSPVNGTPKDECSSVRSSL